MTSGRELYEIWAPHGGVWSPWTAPALFALVKCPDKSADVRVERAQLVWQQHATAHDTAIILDLPGAEAVKFGLGLAQNGYRPVVLINASPAPFHLVVTPSMRPPVVLDMQPIAQEICAGAPWLQELALPSDAPPVFILDSRRGTGTQPLRGDLFDNRWMVFAQDFPSARFLAEQKIKRVILVQVGRMQPLEDLSHVLLRWQEAGIEILAKQSGDASEASPIMVAKPSRFRAIWHRALAIMGFRRSNVGGFGGFVSRRWSGGG